MGIILQIAVAIFHRLQNFIVGVISPNPNKNGIEKPKLSQEKGRGKKENIMGIISLSCHSNPQFRL